MSNHTKYGHFIQEGVHVLNVTPCVDQNLPVPVTPESKGENQISTAKVSARLFSSDINEVKTKLTREKLISKSGIVFYLSLKI